MAVSGCALRYCRVFSFFFTYPSTPEIYTLSLHDALPILFMRRFSFAFAIAIAALAFVGFAQQASGPYKVLKTDRKSTRLNSSHVRSSYAVFCLKKKSKRYTTIGTDHLNSLRSNPEYV